MAEYLHSTVKHPSRTAEFDDWHMWQLQELVARKD